MGGKWLSRWPKLLCRVLRLDEFCTPEAVLHMHEITSASIEQLHCACEMKCRCWVTSKSWRGWQHGLPCPHGRRCGGPNLHGNIGLKAHSSHMHEAGADCCMLVERLELAGQQMSAQIWPGFGEWLARPTPVHRQKSRTRKKSLVIAETYFYFGWVLLVSVESYVNVNGFCEDRGMFEQ